MLFRYIIRRGGDVVELRVLQYFLAIAREESISRAAEYLHITQPTLSRQIKELEDELGRRLFVRGSRKITLTEEGMLLRKRAEEITALLDKTESEIASAGESVSGDVFVGCGETENMRFLVRAAKRLRDDYPGVYFHLFSGHEEAVAERLDKGLVDFALFIGQVKLEKYNYLTLPLEDVWGVIMRNDNPLAAKRSIRPADLEGVPLICSRQMLDNNEMSGWLGRDFHEMEIAATYNLIYNAALMAEEGIGVVLTLKGLGGVHPGGAVCFRPLEPTVTARLVLAWKKYQIFSRAAEKFLEYVQRAAAERGGEEATDMEGKNDE